VKKHSRSFSSERKQNGDHTGNESLKSKNTSKGFFNF